MTNGSPDPPPPFVTFVTKKVVFFFEGFPKMMSFFTWLLRLLTSRKSGFVLADILSVFVVSGLESHHSLTVTLSILSSLDIETSGK